MEDAPAGGSEYPEDRWQPVMESVEGRLSTVELTEDRYRYGRRIWQMEQYASFTAELVRTVKKVRSNLKTTMGFHLDALLPAGCFGRWLACLGRYHVVGRPRHTRQALSESNPEEIDDDVRVIGRWGDSPGRSVIEAAQRRWCIVHGHRSVPVGG